MPATRTTSFPGRADARPTMAPGHLPSGIEGRSERLRVPVPLAPGPVHLASVSTAV